MKKNCGTMKFFTSLLLLATAVADAREIEGGSGTRAREDRMLQLFGGFLGGFGMDLSLECDARCSDEAVCESFLMDMSSGALERQCDAGEHVFHRLQSFLHSLTTLVMSLNTSLYSRTGLDIM